MKQRNIGNVLLYVKRKRVSGLFSTHLSGSATVKNFNMVFYKNYDDFKMFKISCPRNM